ncbi:MAG: universal stress protein [Mycobacteriales bacterium]
MYRSIVVGTDGSDSAQEAVRQAAELAAGSGALLTVVTAFRAMSTLGSMAASSAAMGMVVPPLEIVETPRLEREARAGEPAEVLLDVADDVDADLIVVGSRGLQGAKRFLLGSVPNRVAHHAGRSVLIVHTG